MRRLRAALSVALWAAACGGERRVGSVITDKELFTSEYTQAVSFARQQCPAFARTATSFAEEGGAQSTGAALTVKVAEEDQPTIGDIESRHGAPDSTAERTHYYGDIGFVTDADGEVEELVINCLAR